MLPHVVGRKASLRYGVVENCYSPRGSQDTIDPTVFRFCFRRRNIDYNETLTYQKGRLMYIVRMIREWIERRRHAKKLRQWYLGDQS